MLYGTIDGMTFTIVGLGNPGVEYEQTRHNVGRSLVERFARTHDFSDWKISGKKKSLVAKGKVGKHTVVSLLPETFMNKSGDAVLEQVTSKKAAERLVVLYDDLDLGLGVIRISFGRSSGGHRGVESIIKKTHTKDFVRIRVGVSPTTPSGKVKKPVGEKKVIDFILGKFTNKEEAALKKLSKKVNEALETIIEAGKVTAMNRFN
jgi:PTH1 family peptidyl-tRNA hydrolase